MTIKGTIRNCIFLLLFTACICFLPAPLFPEKDNIRFEPVKISKKIVFSICQDNMGFMWFATDDGLIRYDGANIKIFKPERGNKNTISINFIYYVYADSKGTIWVGTRGGGLNKLDCSSGNFTHYTHDPNNPRSISNDNVYTIYEDKEGVLWAGTYGGGLNKYDAESEDFTHYMYDPANPFSIGSNEIRSIAEDKEGTLWIGTDNGGLNKFEQEKGRFIRYKHDPYNPDSLSSDYIYKICPSASGGLWLATRNGVDKFFPSSGTFKHYRHISDQKQESPSERYVSNYIYTIFEDPSGLLWIGTRGGGLDILDPRKGSYYHYSHEPDNDHSISHNNVFAIFADKSGITWLATLGGGVDKYDPLRTKFSTYTITGKSKNLVNDSIYSFYEDKSGTFWIGTAGGGLFSYNKKDKTYKKYQINPSDPDTLIKNDIYCILEDHEGKFWVGTYGGLFSLDKKSGVFTHHKTRWYKNEGQENLVFSLFEDSAGTLWVGTNEGALNFYDREKDVFNYFPLDPVSKKVSNTYVYAIHETPLNTFWIGTGEGLKKVEFTDSTKRTIKNYTLYRNIKDDLTSLSNNVVLSIHEDSRGTLWIGTRGGGLNKFDRKNESFRNFGTKEGLPNEIIYGIIEDSRGYLWLSTNNGIAKFNARSGTSKNYSTFEGLQGEEFNIGASYQTSDGVIYFGGNSGFNAFLPYSIEENKYIPPVVFTAFKQGGEDMNLAQQPEKTDTIRLGWRNNYFEFEYAALNYSQPDKNRYAYFLEGLDKKWYNAGETRFGRYTGLPGGTYTLIVKGANSDGLWNPKGTEVKIIVSSPFFKTWWFFGIIISILIAFTSTLFNIKITQLKNEKKIRLEQLKAEKEAELLNREKEFTRSLMESIEYAKTIQQSILPSRKKISRYISELFVIWKPRDIVGGDLYWFREISKTKCMFAVIDCTGHSIPGAFMTMITNSELNRVVDENGSEKPSLILAELHKNIKAALSQNREQVVLNNGLDIGLCLIDRKAGQLTFSGAHFSLFYTKSEKVHEIKGDKAYIGYEDSPETFAYHDHTVPYSSENYFYLTSDGYLDQCGGTIGLPLSKKRFKTFLKMCIGKSTKEQKKLLEDKLAEYQKDEPQMDDIALAGFRIYPGSFRNRQDHTYL